MGASSYPFRSKQGLILVLIQQPFPPKPNGQQLNDVVIVRLAGHCAQARLPALVRTPRRPAVDAHEQRREIVGAPLRLIGGAAKTQCQCGHGNHVAWLGGQTSCFFAEVGVPHEQRGTVVFAGLRGPACVQAGALRIPGRLTHIKIRRAVLANLMRHKINPGYGVA